MDALRTKNISTDKIDHPVLNDAGVLADVLRLDKIHSEISGNKWFKLRYYLDDAVRSGKKRIVTFGGAWSNHILATAAACQHANIMCTGIIRGEEPLSPSPILIRARELGMELLFVSRELYRDKIIPAPYNNENCMIIAEGGFGITGANGAATIMQYAENKDYTAIACAVGTGTMLAGLANACPTKTILGISVLKTNPDTTTSVQQLLTTNKAFEIISAYHFEGYAKYNAELINFMNDFYARTGIPADFVYTGKLFFGVIDLVRQGYFTRGSRILLIHSGGLQGNLSLGKGTLIF